MENCRNECVVLIDMLISDEKHVAALNRFGTTCAMQELETTKYPESDKILKKLFSKTLGFFDYLEYLLQSQTFAKEKIKNVLIQIAHLCLPFFFLEENL